MRHALCVDQSPEYYSLVGCLVYFATMSARYDFVLADLEDDAKGSLVQYKRISLQVEGA